MSTTPLWRRPVWLLGHVVALGACLLFVRLGLWQLDRLDEKQARNEIIEARADGAAVDVLSVIDSDAAEYRHVAATGEYDDDRTVTIRNRSLRGTVGRHAVTPLVLDDGSWLYVNRGWVDVDGPVPDAPPGEVTQAGLLRATEERGSIGPRDPAEGVLTELNRIDLDRLQRQAPAGVTVQPLWLQLATSSQASPIPLDPPPRDEGPHLSYAIQWFLFTAVVGIGYPILLRRRTQQAATSEQRGEPAVDGEHLPGDVAGVVAQQEHHR